MSMVTASLSKNVQDCIWNSPKHSKIEYISWKNMFEGNQQEENLVMTWQKENPSKRTFQWRNIELERGREMIYLPILWVCVIDILQDR
jgi:hypothetical protein